MAAQLQQTEKQILMLSKVCKMGTSAFGWHEISDPVICTSSPHGAVAARLRSMISGEGIAGSKSDIA